jgi:hypothetical protein
MTRLARMGYGARRGSLGLAASQSCNAARRDRVRLGLAPTDALLMQEQVDTEGVDLRQEAHKVL